MNTFKSLMLFFSFLVISSKALAVDVSMTLYADSNFNGVSVDFYDEQVVNERNVSRSGYPAQDSYDFFQPVNRNRASSLKVADGYCAILASGEFFDGVWGVYDPGEYNSLGSLNDTVESALTYKKYNSTCNPVADLPMLYADKNYGGRRYPILTPGGAIDSANDVRYDYIYSNGTKIVSNIVSFEGGFSYLASSMTVPSCFEVYVIGNKWTESFTGIDPYEVFSHDFNAGFFPDLGVYNLDNISNFINIDIDESCITPVVSGTETDTYNPSLNSDFVRIESFFKNDTYLNIENGSIASSSVANSSLSAIWRFESTGDGYFNIRNIWKPTQYLHIENGALASGGILQYWYSAQWKLVRDSAWDSIDRANGGKVYRIQNRWKPEQYLHIENGVLESGEVDPGWYSSRWNVHDL